MSNRRNASQLDTLYRRLGRDIRLSWAGTAGDFTDGDLATARRRGVGREIRDLTVASEVDQAEQMLINRLMTRRGELAPIGYPDYGSRHHELIGEPNTERTRNLVKLYVLQALREEPRIERVERCVVTAGARPRDIARVEITVRLIDQPNPLNLVVPLELEAPQ